MATINLLPWRDEFRREKTREFVSVFVLLVILTSLVGYLWYSYFQAEVKQQKSRNTLYDKEISILNAQVSEIKKLKAQRKDLEAKMEVIQDLQNKRPLIVYYFDQLVRTVPDGVFLESLKRKEDVFTVEGESESNNRVSTFMRNIDRSPYFDQPNLKSVSKGGFNLNFSGVVPDRNAN